MAWEEQLSSATGLSLSQFRFTLALFASVLLVAGIRLLRNTTLRHLYALVTGVAIIYYPFGSGIIHVLPMAVAAYLALHLAPRRAGAVAWCTVFPYLIYLHVVNASGESWKTGNMDFTGGAMVAVLKLVSICVCRQDSFRKNKEDLSAYQAAHQLVSTPTLLEFLSYLFGLGNLLAGPFFEFSEYKEFIELKGGITDLNPSANSWQGRPQARKGFQPHPGTCELVRKPARFSLNTVETPWAPNAGRSAPNYLGHGFLALLEGLWHMGVYLGLTLSGWDMDHYHSAWYYGQPLIIKCAAICVIGLVYQLRYYFSWKITEASYVFAGLDFMGYDPATGEAQWGRCRNCSFLGVWLADSARNVPLNWNICTGNFLRRYVYERVAPRNRKPGFQSLLFTQLVSAIWHGLYPGYLMFFVGTAVWIFFSQIVYKTEAYLPAVVRKHLLYRAIKIIWTVFVLNYMACAFQLLDYKSSMEAYASVNYFPFIVMVVVNVLGSFVKQKRPAKPPTGPGGATPMAVNGKNGGNKTDSRQHACPPPTPNAIAMPQRKRTKSTNKIDAVGIPPGFERPNEDIVWLTDACGGDFKSWAYVLQGSTTVICFFCDTHKESNATISRTNWDRSTRFNRMRSAL
ncbi:hypothetical protein VOLCADRAFT_120919 [Volvox carteri f. nagariensis]|uniref:Membrane bound O-acyl transferase n=1 Tax=Volvox carteri f. nagariensis TaxID=3068 RepID=D8TWQ3_VOLCA|nr:uncharacterized protein VOLCADRAFT_120919 [Volvox carteri f. nagariensis]EFJ48091.1 hypothetical protein VOLCADRAFT_120919 [Volvox carteri f. nagariensis]|eukprot:XP_002950776.1 hypothetical protein VOLCADRAFT_120919 [Volvox carteri f. nagariensis]